MKILKTFDAGAGVRQILYTHVRIQEGDNLAARHYKAAIARSVAQWTRQDSVKLELLILKNFDRDASFCTFTFSSDRLPECRQQAQRRMQYFTAKLRRMGYNDIKYIVGTEHRHGAARWHFHAVISGAPPTALRNVWQATYGLATATPLNVNKVIPHATSRGLATYMTKERPERLGQHIYSRSRGRKRLDDPIITREFVSDDYQLICPDGCREYARGTLAANPFGSSDYIAYLTPRRGGGDGGVRGGTARNSNYK